MTIGRFSVLASSTADSQLLAHLTEGLGSSLPPASAAETDSAPSSATTNADLFLIVPPSPGPRRPRGPGAESAVVPGPDRRDNAAGRAAPGKRRSPETWSPGFVNV